MVLGDFSTDMVGIGETRPKSHTRNQFASHNASHLSLESLVNHMRKEMRIDELLITRHCLFISGMEGYADMYAINIFTRTSRK